MTISTLTDLSIKFPNDTEFGAAIRRSRDENKSSNGTRRIIDFIPNDQDLGKFMRDLTKAAAE